MLYTELIAKKVAEAEAYLTQSIFSEYHISHYANNRNGKAEVTVRNGNLKGIDKRPDKAEYSIHFAVDGAGINIDGAFGSMHLNFNADLMHKGMFENDFFKNMSIGRFTDAIERFNDDIFIFDREICRATLNNIFSDQLDAKSPDCFNKHQMAVYNELMEASRFADSISSWHQQLGFIQYEDIVTSGTEEDLLYKAGNYYAPKVVILYVATKVVLGNIHGWED